MSTSTASLYKAQTIGLCERRAMEEYGYSDSQLMEMAGTAAFQHFQRLFPEIRQIAVFCGAGNNAGDGYVFARLAQEQGYIVHLYALKQISELAGPAQRAAEAALAAGLQTKQKEEMRYLAPEVELIIDALLGTGLQAEPKGAILEAISLINASDLPVLALDLPSGLNGDTGAVPGSAVIADMTFSFIAEKPGMYTAEGPDHCGKIMLEDLDLSRCLLSFAPDAYSLCPSQLRSLKKARKKNSHKSLYGHVLVVGGGIGMPGAAYLAALSALRVGAGIVSIAAHPNYAQGIMSDLAEAMIYPISKPSELESLINKASVCIIGPGLGTDARAEALFSMLMAAELPLIIDASAIHMLAKHPQYDDNWILTPHPGEAAKLLACSVQAIQEDRLGAARAIQARFGGAVILKGAGTIIQTAQQDLPFICTAGNPGMSTAGMGDILSGIVGGLLAQGFALADAAKLGVWLHAKASDDAVAEQGELGLLASDIIPYVRRLLNAL